MLPLITNETMYTCTVDMRAPLGDCGMEAWSPESQRFKIITSGPFEFPRAALMIRVCGELVVVGSYLHFRIFRKAGYHPRALGSSHQSLDSRLLPHEPQLEIHLDIHLLNNTPMRA